MITYLLQSCLGIAIFWLAYRAFFKGRAAAKINRTFLMGGLILPLLFPLIPLEKELLVAAEPILLPAINVGAVSNVAEQSATSFNWTFAIYLCGFALMLMYQLGGLRKFIALKSKAEKTGENGIFNTTENVMPFSFFGTIFLPKNIDESQKELIVLHENWHIKLGHSWDVAWANVVQIMLWFFPLMPQYLRDLRAEHEYEVDAKMLRKTNFRTYADSLLNASLMPIGHAQFHSYSHKTLKNRFERMTQKQKQNAWKLLFLLPMVFGMIYLNAWNSHNEQARLLKANAEVAFMETDMPPKFNHCATATNKEMAIECFLRGVQTYILKNVKYPKSAMQANAQGTVYVQFTIDENGFVKNPTIVGSNVQNKLYETELQNAALAAFHNFEQLQPAEKDGKNVAVKFTMPIDFLMNEESRKNEKQERVYGPQNESVFSISGEGC